MKSFKIISSFNNGKRIVTMDEAQEFTNLLAERFAVHGTVIKGLSDGFRWDFDHSLDLIFQKSENSNRKLLIFVEKIAQIWLFMAKILLIFGENDYR